MGNKIREKKKWFGKNLGIRTLSGELGCFKMVKPLKAAKEREKGNCDPCGESNEFYPAPWAPGGKKKAVTELSAGKKFA